MARTRLINPEFFLHEGLGLCSPHARLLFIALWTQADREGRLRWIPLRIHGQTFPHEPGIDVSALATELVEAGCLTVYEADSRRFAHVLNFTRWQSPHRNETSSRIPAPEDADHGLFGALLSASTKGRPKVDQRTACTSLVVTQSHSPTTGCPDPGGAGTPSTTDRASGVLAEELRDAIATHSPQYAKKVSGKRLSSWAEIIERLIRLDEAQPADIRRVIQWAHLDEEGAFWRANILSASALRKQYPRLRLLIREKKTATEVDVDAAAIAAAKDLGARI